MPSPLQPAGGPCASRIALPGSIVAVNAIVLTRRVAGGAGFFLRMRVDGIKKDLPPHTQRSCNAGRVPAFDV
jgi:hypothetical protein